MFTLYGIKNCSTVKKARDWLAQHDIAYQFHDVRVDGLTLAQLQDFTARVDWQVLLNRSSTSWRQLTPEQNTDVTLEKAVQLLHDTPTLLKRPVLDMGERLIVGFKVEDYQKLL
ncbi:MAG: ArsC family reductase [Methylococcales bacterium]|nr:ArsC family reductase [Methylococcales bacterium]